MTAVRKPWRELPVRVVTSRKAAPRSCIVCGYAIAIGSAHRERRIAVGAAFYAHEECGAHVDVTRGDV